MKYLVAYDGSAHSKGALEKVLSFVTPKDSITVLSLVKHYQDLTPAGGGWLPVLTEEDFAEIDRNGVVYFTDLHKKLDVPFGETKHEFVTAIVDDIREGLLEEAGKNGADILVLGSRGLSAIGRFFLGSVSEYAVTHATIPVLVVPPSS
mmetsp:Transcript_7464/g.10074  ORF Transcript_7464/g.10074 Transcript_7464/m.10074 type:complete len:149 (+) Transcript_7464:19-465(+)|eukprot:CAMPEP_0201482934 /NCGR_PEP_ID=MMETSP0151_2-20130828/7188_1 /ASSEMBLY_ACC=CAM_ASM_000257 /TAXON_ID=200890 /ORGANISM="Paramoeba atlantica, Strain 621/1 / CCAP 1560/9" /LENGTH=148 /DNA_ID=CAMNT_0047865855 /DNA_START=19 /DNA_END=465 /DNA_ORIENTATION=-